MVGFGSGNLGMLAFKCTFFRGSGLLLAEVVPCWQRRCRAWSRNNSPGSSLAIYINIPRDLVAACGDGLDMAGTVGRLGQLGSGAASCASPRGLQGFVDAAFRREGISFGTAKDVSWLVARLSPLSLWGDRAGRGGRGTFGGLWVTDCGNISSATSAPLNGDAADLAIFCPISSSTDQASSTNSSSVPRRFRTDRHLSSVLFRDLRSCILLLAFPRKRSAGRVWESGRRRS